MLPFEWATAPTKIVVPNPADGTPTLREWEVVIADGNGPRDQIMAVAVHEDGSILTLSCPTASEYCAPDAFRLENFSPHGLLLAYIDYTSTKEQHLGLWRSSASHSMRGQNVGKP